MRLGFSERAVRNVVGISMLAKSAHLALAAITTSTMRKDWVT